MPPMTASTKRLALEWQSEIIEPRYLLLFTLPNLSPAILLWPNLWFCCWLFNFVRRLALLSLCLKEMLNRWLVFSTNQLRIGVKVASQYNMLCLYSILLLRGQLDMLRGNAIMQPTALERMLYCVQQMLEFEDIP